MKKTKVSFKILLVLLSFMLLFGGTANAYAINNTFLKDNMTNKKEALRMEQRKLWSEHAIWTGNYVIATLANVEDAGKMAERLLKNQDDTGASFNEYYGVDNGQKLGKLLREHVEYGTKVINAIKNNNKEELDKYNKLWYKNSEDITKFLSNLNTNWNEKELKKMFDDHLASLTEQVLARINKDGDKYVKIYDRGYNHMLILADLISDGIIKQFPEKFK